MSFKKIVVAVSLASALSLPVLADTGQSQAGPSNQGQSGPVVSDQGLPAPSTAQAGVTQVLQGEDAPAAASQQGLPVSSNQSGAAVKNFFQGLGSKIKNLLSKLKSQSASASSNQGEQVKVDASQGLPLPATGQQQKKPATGQGQALPTQQSE